MVLFIHSARCRATPSSFTSWSLSVFAQKISHLFANQDIAVFSHHATSDLFRLHGNTQFLV